METIMRYETMGFLSFEGIKQNLLISGVSVETIDYIERTLQIHCIHAHRLGAAEGYPYNRAWKAYEELLNQTATSMRCSCSML